MAGKHDSKPDEKPRQFPPAADTMEYSYTVKIPKDRIAVLIGKEGEIKRSFEAELGTRISIDSKEGDVTITGKDSLKIYMLKEVIKAVARGFNPELAELLLKQDYVLEIITITDYAKNKNHIPRLKGRIIGTKGKSRRNIEHLTETHICVYGKTISVIGQSESVTLCKKALESLLQGSPHSSVYSFLERKKKELKRKEGGW
ncbi:MAG: KH domain-containing protein [Nanoarchaeota archaeon]